MVNKAKASASDFNPNTLALAFNLGGLAEWLNAPVCKTGNGATNTVQGFKSLTRRQTDPAGDGANHHQRIRTVQPRPHESANSVSGFWL